MAIDANGLTVLHPQLLFPAAGSFDKCLHIWSVKDGCLIKTLGRLRHFPGIFHVLKRIVAHYRVLTRIIAY